MQDIDYNIETTALKAVAEQFLRGNEVEEIPVLLESLERLYISRALGITSNKSDEESAKSLTRIALALEGQLYLISQTSENQELLRAYSILAGIFEYVSRIMDQNEKPSAEFWLRASIAYSQANQTANAQLSAKKYLDSLTKNEMRYYEKVIHTILIYMARDLQSFFKETEELLSFLNKTSLSVEEIESKEDHIRRLGCINLLESTRYIAEYLRSGSRDSLQNWHALHERGQKLLNQSGDNFLIWLASRLERIHRHTIEYALWNFQEIIPPDFIRVLTNHKTDPIFELWPSQKEAIQRILRAKARRHQTLVMSPSAGKTLVAAILIAKELLSHHGDAFYVTPFRALVTEVADFLARYLPDIGIKVSHLPGKYDSIPELERLVGGQANVYVLTPEKLDLLWRIGDNRLKNCNVFVFDEVQLIAERGRGLRLELLISKIKTLYGRYTRILLLSAVIPPSNLANFIDWLGSQSSNAEEIAWKPTRTLQGLFWRARQEDHRGDLYYIGKFNILNILPPNPTASHRDDAAELAWKYQQHLGPVLLYCNSRLDAEQAAGLILNLAKSAKVHENPQLLQASSYVRNILGKNFLMPEMLKHGIAYHHASLPEAVRQTVEKLAREGLLRVLTCTSTLAEGVNLNVGTVIIGSTYQGGERMDGLRIRNLAGRAGRALKDTEGHVVLMSTVARQVLTDKEFSKLESRFFNYLSSMSMISGFNTDLDVVEAELLARLYKRELDPEKLEKTTKSLLDSTLFARQANTNQFRAIWANLTDHAERVVKHKPIQENQLKVFAETGLALDHCKKLDEAAKQFATMPNLNFRLGNQFNWSLLEHIINACLLPSEKFASQIQETVRDPVGLIRSWLEGNTVLQISSKTDPYVSKVVLSRISYFLYGYVTEDVAWACAAFVRLLGNNLAERDKTFNLPKEWQLLPNYLKYGVKNAGALLLTLLGLQDRDYANQFAESAPMLSDTSTNWLEIIAWTLSISGDETIGKVQENLIDNLTVFTLPVLSFRGNAGPAVVNENGEVIKDGLKIGRVGTEFVPIFKALRHSGFQAEIKIDSNQLAYIEVIPS